MTSQVTVLPRVLLLLLSFGVSFSFLAAEMVALSTVSAAKIKAYRGELEVSNGVLLPSRSII